MDRIARHGTEGEQSQLLLGGLQDIPKISDLGLEGIRRVVGLRDDVRVWVRSRDED